MLRIPLPRLRKRSRKYAIKRDEYGRSARQRAFEAFDRGKRPGEVSEIVGISPRTAYRYLADWKKLPENLELRYRMVKTVVKNHPGFSETTISTLADYLDMSEEEVVARLESPWGLKQLVMGKWPDYRTEKTKSEREARLEAALRLVVLIEQSGMTPGQITAVISRLLKESGQNRAHPQSRVSS